MKLLLDQPGLQILKATTDHVRAHACVEALLEDNVPCLKLIMQSRHWTGLPRAERLQEEIRCFLTFLRSLAAIDAFCELACVSEAHLIRCIYPDRRNALHETAYHNRLPAVLCKLIVMGVRCTAKTANGETPADCTQQRAHNASPTAGQSCRGQTQAAHNRTLIGTQGRRLSQQAQCRAEADCIGQMLRVQVSGQQ